MNIEMVELLRCPKTGTVLRLETDEERDGQIVSGQLVSASGRKYPIRNFVPRFVRTNNYAANFGLQWNKFRRTQLDTFCGHPITAERFWAQSGLRKSDLKGKRILDVGCGAGRFAEIALDAGARMVALDYSEAVDACLANHFGRFANTLDVFQGDIYWLPFLDEQFDFVYCSGVLQHTPDVKTAFMSLPKQVRPGGSIAVDIYRKHWSNWLHPKYWLRPLTTRMSPERLFSLITVLAPTMLSMSVALKRIPLFGKALARAVPIANYSGELPLSKEQLADWAILDTFDWFGPTYDQPQTIATLKQWFFDARLERVEIIHPAHLSGRGRKMDRT